VIIPGKKVWVFQPSQMLERWLIMGWWGSWRRTTIACRDPAELLLAQLRDRDLRDHAAITDEDHLLEPERARS
jgi:hypothetical protein